MLLELVQSILDTINNGGIPIIENSWKYVMKNECVKRGKELVDNFANEIRVYRDKNKKKNKMNEPESIKVVLIGESGVGKT